MGELEAEIIVIGAGPAGLTAGLYLARYRRDVLIIHDGKSRAQQIPKTHNAPGFPDGVAGPELIDKMTRHAMQYGARFAEGEIRNLTTDADMFRLTTSDGRNFASRAVILASGIFLNEVELPHDVHERAIRAGVLRYCPICDGYEHNDQRIGVLGCDTNGAAEAKFLRRYSADVTLLPLTHDELTDEQLHELSNAGIAVERGTLVKLEPGDDHMGVHLQGRDDVLKFDVIYPALGCRPRSELAEQLGIKVKAEGCVPAGAVADSGIPGFFAAGDVVEGLDQISVAMGHGALAATKAHNWLREQDGHTLQASD